MGEYWCSRHQGWHVGHSDRRRDENKEMKALVEFFVLWELSVSCGGVAAPVCLRRVAYGWSE